LAAKQPTPFYRERTFGIVSNINRRNDNGLIWEQFGQLMPAKSQLANKLFSDAVDTRGLRSQKLTIDGQPSETHHPSIQTLCAFSKNALQTRYGSDRKRLVSAFTVVVRSGLSRRSRPILHLFNRDNVINRSSPVSYKFKSGRCRLSR
jgi:hypothetical protein